MFTCSCDVLYAGPTPLHELFVLPTLAGEGRGEKLPGGLGDFCGS